MGRVRTIEDIRHCNLLALLAGFPTLQAFADRIDRSHSQVSQLKNRSANSSTGKPRNIDSTMARHIEHKLGLDEGWMDNDHERNSWPFPLVDRAQWEMLSAEARTHVQRGMVSLLAQYAAAPPSAGQGFSYEPGEFTSGLPLHEPLRKPYRTGT